MSDTPLFRKVDELEATMAPQQPLAEDGSPAAANAEAQDTADTSETGGVPVLAAGAMGAGVGMGGTGASGGAAGGIGPALGAAALANETEDQDTDTR